MPKPPAASRYGAEFDALADRWRTAETEHDQYHPDRSLCGGVGGCPMMERAVDLEHEMIEVLEQWRAQTVVPNVC